MQTDKTLHQALMRELYEETSITTSIHIIEDVWRFHWGDKNEMHLEFVFGIEVAHYQEITLNPKEHEAYKWTTIEE